jgi:hypothetical protein
VLLVVTVRCLQVKASQTRMKIFFVKNVTFGRDEQK